MGWISFTEGVALSTLLFLLAQSLQSATELITAPTWIALCVALFPIWGALSALTARLARVKRAEQDWERFKLTLQSSERGNPSSKSLLRFARKDAAALGSAAGGILGLGLFVLVVPGAWGPFALGWATLFLFMERRRLLLQTRRRERVRKQRDRWRSRMERSLRGMRTFRSLGGERFLERKMSDHFAIFLSGVRSVSKQEKWGERSLPALLVVGFCVILGGLAHEGTPGLGNAVFLALGAFIVGERGARALANRKGTLGGFRSPVEIHPIWHPMFHPEAPIHRFEFLDLTSDGDRMGPLHIRIQRGEIRLLTQPDFADVRAVLEILSGLAPVKSGKVSGFDLKGKWVWRHEATDGPILPAEWVAYWERKPTFIESTIRENLVFDNPMRISDVKIWDTLRRLGADSLVQELGGLDAILPTEMLDRSELLLLSLARVLLPDRPLLVMEHPGYVGEWESIQDRLRRYGDFPATIVGTVMIPATLNARPEISETRFRSLPAAVHDAL